MEKRVFAKVTRLPNVVGRVDYISNPKRQENLLAFYQTPTNPECFWKALAKESQALAAYNKTQIEEHNKKEFERFATGEIKQKKLLKTVEAREFMICLPNDIYSEMDHQEIAEFIANDIRSRHNIECAVGVHMNKTKTNYHAHVILPERRLLERTQESIATRNTYFNAEGKRSTKKECVDENGELKHGCRLVKKGEQLHQRLFSEKDPLFASKGFTYGEKVHFAKIFNQWSRDQWVVYNHYTNPHVRLYSLKREEPEALRAWKERENSKIRLYNAAVDKLLSSGELTKEQALSAKQEFYEKRNNARRDKKELHKEWERWYSSEAVKKNYNEIWRNERRRIRYSDSGRERSVFELMVILGLGMAGINVLNKERELSEDLIVRPRKNIQAKTDPFIQQMIDDVAVAAGRRAPSELAAESRVMRLAGVDERKRSIHYLISNAVEYTEQSKKNNQKLKKEEFKKENLDL